MIITSGYGGSLKERAGNRDYLKKKKSQEAFYIKAKLNSQLNEQLKHLNPRKSQPRLSTSMAEIPKDDPRRACASLDLDPSPADPQPLRPASSKQKKTVDCWSDRNAAPVADASKAHKFRKFSSNAELEEQRPESQRRKLSLVEAPAKRVERLGVTAWLVLVRKLFVEELKKRGSRTIKLSLLYSYIQRLDHEGLDEFSLLIEPLEYEVELSRAQIQSVCESYFSARKTKGKAEQGRATYFEVMGCLLQFQGKNGGQAKQNHKSTSSEEEAVETARFQEGGEELKKRKLSDKKAELGALMPKLHTHKHMRENGKENAVISANLNGEALFKSPACAKSRQSLNPSHSPFSVEASVEGKGLGGSGVEVEGSGLEKEEGQGLLGVLTMEGKSPRELMVSQIYESIQKEGFVQQNNVSFSLEQLELESHLSFEHTVHSFEEVLRKIQSIQSSYRPKLDESRGQQEEVNLFLQQLINYRIACSGEPFEEDAYSYLVSFENLWEFREHNRGIMQALLQSSYLREYFASLEGVKIQNSLPFLKSVAHLLPPQLRILNLADNGLASTALLTDLTAHALEFLNLNRNALTDLAPILRTFTHLRELHAHSNAVSSLREAKVGSQELRMIDLSSNRLQEERDLGGLVGVSSLVMINVLDNPLVQGNWKAEWTGSISINNIYTMDNLYVMSSYAHQKDITFSLDRPRTRPDRTDPALAENTRTNGDARQKPTPKAEQPRPANKLHEPPKQKISKIKAFIDGKVI